MIRKNRVLWLWISLLCTVGILTGCTSAQSNVQGNNTAQESGTDYPRKPIELIVPTNAGGDTDINGRIFAKYLSDVLGQQVVIVNTAGAGGSIATQTVIDSPADGYRVLWYHNSTILNNITGVSEINFDDMIVASIPLVDETAILVARTDSGWNDLTDMIAYAKENPGEITVGMETATLAQLVPIAVEDKMDVQFNIVDIGTASDRLTGLLGGQIDMYFVQYGVVRDYIATGDFVALCALSDERNPAYPDVPTAKELGCDLTFDKFFYFAFPKVTPEEIINRFNEAVIQVSADENLQAEFAELFLYPAYHDASAAGEIIEEIETFYSAYKDLLK